MNNNLVFVNVNIDYLRTLHNVDNEVQYSSIGYEGKPFIGILTVQNNREYVIPLTSAKEKHISWRDRYSDGRYLITEVVERNNVNENAIYKNIENDIYHVKRIYAALDVKKMIPIKEGLYNIVSFEILNTDTNEQINYKILQQKEYRACVRLFEDISRKAILIYNRQKESGRIQRFCCNFTLLEHVCDNYQIRQ